jgi:hypothetical protein
MYMYRRKTTIEGRYTEGEVDRTEVEEISREKSRGGSRKETDR